MKAYLTIINHDSRIITMFIVQATDYQRINVPFELKTAWMNVGEKSNVCHCQTLLP